jgi:DNA-binding response OmpR family regulator
MKILLVEDELILRTAVADFLREAGYQLLTASDGDAGLALATTEKPDLVLLDIMMPKRDGISVCVEMRRRKLAMPVIMLTAKGQVQDRIYGLESGADDYGIKPFSLGELLARIRALLRRTHSPQGLALPDIIHLGSVQVDLTTRTVSRHNQSISLNAKEYGMLKMLIEAEGNTITRDAFLEVVWGYAPFVATRTVDNHMARLRSKLEPDPEQPAYLLTVPKVGYRLRLP